MRSRELCTFVRFLNHSAMGRKGDEMKVLTVFCLVCFLTIGVLAQSGGVLYGRITQDGKPVPGANVNITVHDPMGNKTFTAVTDADGKYRFENLQPGNYMVIAEGERGKGIGYEGAINVTANASVSLDLQLSMKTYAVFSSQLLIQETVNISADQSQPIEEISKTVNVIDAQEMRDRADFSLADTLRTIPGFRVQQLGGFGRTATIKTRGLRNQDTAVLIDGIRFRDASAITGDASPFLSDFTLTSVSKIEVLRGSGSSLYGTNAIGGTLDFQTPRPQSGLHGQVSGAFGGFGLGRFRGNISDGTKDGKFGYNLGVSRTVYTKGIDGQDDAHNTNIQSRIEYNPWSRTNISTRFFVTDAFVRLNSSPDTFGTLPPSNSTIITANPGVNFTFDANDPDSDQKSKFFNGQIVLTQVFTDGVVFQGYYSGLKTSRKNSDGPLAESFPSESTSFFDGTIQTANGHIDWSPGRVNKLTAGYEFEHEKFGNDGQTPSGFGNFFTRAFQSSHTFYVQDLLSLLNNKLQLAGGFRAQFFDLKTPEFSLLNAPYTNLTLDNPPNAYTFDGSTSYFFEKSGTKIRAHVGNGYRVPSLYERFGTFFATFLVPNQFVPIGAPNLKPERSIAFDSGVEQNLFGNRARLTAVYFYTKLIDTIGYGPLLQPDPFGRVNSLSGGGYLNNKGGIARGAEFSGTIRPTKSTDIFASYTYTNSDQRVPQVSGSGIIRTLGIPANQFTLVATQRIKRFWVNADLLATSSYLAPIFDTNSFTFRTYVYRFNGNRRLDLTAGYTFPINKDKFNLRLFGTIENLLDNEYYENGFQTPGRNGRVGLSFGF
jgi:vitamin B12 transporter